MSTEKNKINRDAVFDKALKLDASFKKGRLLTIIFWIIALTALLIYFVVTLAFLSTIDDYGSINITFRDICSGVGLLSIFFTCMYYAIHGTKKANIIIFVFMIIVILIQVVEGYYSISLSMLDNMEKVIKVWFVVSWVYPYVIMVMMILQSVLSDCRHFSDIGSKISSGLISDVSDSSTIDDIQ